jgi:uncharacterized RDD family membrane protein YckC
MAGPMKSPDGLWFWDGSQWRSLVSPDGYSIWTGTAWVPRPPGSTISSPPAAPPAGSGMAVLSGAGASMPPAPPSYGPPPSFGGGALAPQPYVSQAPAATRFAGIGVRFLALVVDGLITGIPLILISIALLALIPGALTISSNGDGQTAYNTTAQAPLNLVSLAVGFFYFTYFWSTGATPGMRLLGIRVADAQTLGNISFGRAALRYIGYLVSTWCCFIGLIWAAFDSRRQGWHDKIAGTYVLYSG